MRLTPRRCRAFVFRDSFAPPPPSDFATCFSDPPVYYSLDVLAIVPFAVPALAKAPPPPERGPGLAGGTVMLDDVYFTTSRKSPFTVGPPLPQL